MKKSKIKPEDLLKDLNKIFENIDKLDSVDIEKDNLEKISKKINRDSNYFSKKYKEYPSEESKDGLDTKE